MNPVALLLWKEYICFCEPLAGCVLRQLRDFSTAFPEPEVLGGGEKRPPAESQPRVCRSWLGAGCARPLLPPHLMHLLPVTPCPVGFVGQPQQVQLYSRGAHGLSVPVVLWGSREINVSQMWGHFSRCYEELTDPHGSELNASATSWVLPRFILACLYSCVPAYKGNRVLCQIEIWLETARNCSQNLYFRTS